MVERSAEPRLLYLCLQARRPGQATFTHVAEIVDGLRTRHWRVDLIEPHYRRNPGDPGQHTWRRLLATAGALARAVLTLPGASACYLRLHVLSLPLVLAARLLRVPVVVEINGPWQEVETTWPIVRWMPGVAVGAQRAQVRAADAAVAVTEQLAELALRAGSGRAEVIPNGANVELFRPGVELAERPARPYAIFFGALAPWQGIPVMLDAVRSPEWPTGVDLVIAGDGVDRALVEDAVLTDSRVRYLGTLAYEDVPSWVSNSIAGLSTQVDTDGRLETGLSPLKVYEILACGVPVVVSAAPGQRDLVDRVGCGIVIPPGDPGALARAVARLNADAELRRRMGDRGRGEVVARESWDVRAAATDSLLRSLLRRSPASAPARPWPTRRSRRRP